MADISPEEQAADLARLTELCARYGLTWRWPQRCEHCGKTFTGKASRRFCSKSCAGVIAMRNRWDGIPRKAKPEPKARIARPRRDRSEATAKWYAENRKNNPEWAEKNKARAKAWRSRRKHGQYVEEK